MAKAKPKRKAKRAAIKKQPDISHEAPAMPPSEQIDIEAVKSVVERFRTALTNRESRQRLYELSVDYLRLVSPN